MSKFISPFSDWSFKYIFGSESAKEILIGFLNALFNGTYVIKDVQFCNNEQSPKSKEDRATIFDIYCETDKGDYVIVEMQNCRQFFFKDRALYYMSRSIVEQAEKGDGWRYKLKAVCGVFFLNFKMEDIPGKNPEQSLSEVVLMDVESKTISNPKFKQYFIELPRFVKGEKECETIYDKWIYILKNLDTMETMPFAEERNAAFAKLAARAAQANMTPAERAAYEESRKNLWDFYNTIDTAVEEGRAEARAEGRAEGVESTQRKAVLKMHSKGYSVSEICDCIDMSEEEVMKIIQTIS